jgi:hypothetical protein
LRNLDDRRLNDLGIARSEIESTGQGTSMVDAIRSIGVTEVTYYPRLRQQSSV